MCRARLGLKARVLAGLGFIRLRLRETQPSPELKARWLGGSGGGQCYFGSKIDRSVSRRSLHPPWHAIKQDELHSIEITAGSSINPN